MTLKKVTDIILQTVDCNLEDITPEAELTALGIESLDAITILFEIEDAFNIDIPNEEIKSLVTVNDILDLLKTTQLKLVQ